MYRLTPTVAALFVIFFLCFERKAGAEEVLPSFQILDSVETPQEGPPVSIAWDEMPTQELHVDRPQVVQPIPTGRLWFEEPVEPPGELVPTQHEEFAILDNSIDQAAEYQELIPLDSSKGACIDCEQKPWLKWKSTDLKGTWLPGSGNHLGLTELSASGSIVSPRLPFLFITPTYKMTLLSGPKRTDIPETLHRASVSFMAMMPIKKGVFGQVRVSPGIATDFENTGSDAMRITGHAMAIFAPSAELQWVLGVVYVDREDVSLLPMVGATLNPSEDRKIELMFPKPKISQRISHHGDYSTWAYLTAEFGGGSWAIRRANGRDDVVTIRDYRILGGCEYQLPEDQSYFWEAGLVFGRRVEYSSQQGDYGQDPTILVRGGMTF